MAANLSSTVVIPCEVFSYPPVTSISFQKGSELIKPDEKYSLRPIMYNIDDVIYRQRGELVIKNVAADDYGTYRCVTENTLGSSDHNIALSRTSRPDKPTLTYSDLSWFMVNLSWQPGYDGGLTQTYSVHQITGSEEKILAKDITDVQLYVMSEYMASLKFEVYS